MLNPFNRDFFQLNFDFRFKGFRENETILSIIKSTNSTLKQFLVFNNKEDYLIIGFDFINERILPVEAKDIEGVLNSINTFMLSKYNFIDFSMENLEESIEHFSKQKIKREDFYTFENLTILATSQRNIITMECEIYNNNNFYKPNTSTVIHNKNGFIYGEIVFSHVIKNDFCNMHLSDDLLIKYRNNKHTTETVGSIYEVKPLGLNQFTLILSSFIFELNQAKMGYLSSKNLNPHSAFFEILRTPGINKQQINLGSYSSGRAPYLIIIPIENLNLHIEEFGLGDILYLNKEETHSRIQGIKELLEENLDNEYHVFAHTIVESDNTYDAYQIALHKIQTSLHMLVHMSKNERVLNFYNLGNQINTWNRSRLHQHPKCSTFYYAENIIGFEKVFKDSKSVKSDNSLTIDSYFSSAIQEMDWYERILYKKINGKESKNEKKLFNALKWLNRSWEASNIEDKVIYTNISMEFLVDEIKTEPYIPKEVRNKFKGLLKELLSNDEVFTEETSKKIKEKKSSGFK
ncbi:hypothetical protein F6Y02_41560 (plasmid) [Bacillus megaterium]|nr:hypothetical protein [Priestia megaterium]